VMHTNKPRAHAPVAKVLPFWRGSTST
jgi:hypothetical protein